MEKITVFLADWQVLFREGIHFTLSGEEDMEVIGEDVGNEQALDFIEANPPQVAILNASHDKVNGFEATRQIKQILPEVSVILVMDNYNEGQLFDALKSGASACFTKDVDPEVVVNSIREAVKGKQPISEVIWKPEIASRILDDFTAFSSLGEEVGKLLAHLTTREAEILHQIADGNTREQVASTLVINDETLDNRLQSAHYKLVVNDQKLVLIEAAQSSLPAISRVSFTGKPGTEYITKEEFTAFKESLKEHFKFLSGDIS
ncbi:MAG: helix-turn-helix domain-containing protein [Dehalococcoidia bacterium]|nr:MAG: helix-turn-helix domain-containing protein [Dehalococcoidia bacterium]